MKIVSAILSLVLLVTGSASGQWQKDGKRAEDTPESKSVKGFGGHLIVVENPRAFMEEWLKPETPKIDDATDVRRDVLFGAFVLFAGCKPDAQGMCNAEVDYTIYKPDGSLYAESKGQPLWKEEVPPPPIIQLSRAILGFRMEKNDPVGEYKVKAKVSDLNADVSFVLETKFRLK
jgi:hypothetical protein